MSRKSSRIDILSREKFFERLQVLRKALNLSGEEIAKKLEIAPRVWWRYEYGETEPGVAFIVKLIKIFKVSPVWLLTGEGEMFLEPRVVPLEDAPLVSMIAYIKEVWERGDQKERAWLEIQFSKCFPDFVEWRRMREEEGEKKVVEVKKD